MTEREALERVEAIRQTTRDNETAHQMEDELHQDVLRWIATESRDPLARVLAAAALRSLDIKYIRWYA